jgi:hypothetical protein
MEQLGSSTMKMYCLDWLAVNGGFLGQHGSGTWVMAGLRQMMLTDFGVGNRRDHLADGLVQQHGAHNGRHGTEGAEPEDQGHGEFALPLHVEAEDYRERQAQHQDVEREAARDLSESDRRAVHPQPGRHEREGDRVELEKHEEKAAQMLTMPMTNHTTVRNMGVGKTRL